MSENTESRSPTALASSVVACPDTIDLLDRDDLDHADWICWKRRLQAPWDVSGHASRTIPRTQSPSAAVSSPSGSAHDRDFLVNCRKLAAVRGGGKRSFALLWPRFLRPKAS
jgi:hypothetical protein